MPTPRKRWAWTKALCAWPCIGCENVTGNCCATKSRKPWLIRQTWTRRCARCSRRLPVDVAAGILPAVEDGILPPGIDARIFSHAGTFQVHALPGDFSAGRDATALRQARCPPLQLSAHLPCPLKAG